MSPVCGSKTSRRDPVGVRQPGVRAPQRPALRGRIGRADPIPLTAAAAGAYHAPVSERVLAKGENAALPEELKRVQVLLSWSEDGGAADVDAAALVLNPAGK